MPQAQLAALRCANRSAAINGKYEFPIHAALSRRRAVEVALLLRIPAGGHLFEFHHNTHALQKLLMQHIHTHRGERQTTQYVRRAEPYHQRRGGSGWAHIYTRQQITKTDCGQTHETKVDAVEDGPLLQQRNDQRAERDVRDQQQHTEADWQRQ